MTIENGFKIDEPDIFVPWGIEENALVDLFQGKDLKKMAAGYHTICAQSLSGLKCQLGFHFEPRRNGKLKELEFFRTNYDNQKKSYDEFQKYFVMSFGTPTKTTNGTEGFKNHQ